MEGKRKIQYCEDGVLCHSYVLDGGKTYNPCGCGSNVYHLEYDGKKVMKTGSENFIFAEGKEWEPAGEGVVRQIMGYNDDIMVVKVKFEKGAVGAVHHHIH